MVNVLLIWKNIVYNDVFNKILIHLREKNKYWNFYVQV